MAQPLAAFFALATFAALMHSLHGAGTCGKTQAKGDDPFGIVKQDPMENVELLTRASDYFRTIEKKPSGAMKTSEDVRITVPMLKETYDEADRDKENQIEDSGPSLQGRIVGGVRAGRGELCWQVSVNGECGGTILSDRFVLTAAHCLQKYTFSQENIQRVHVITGLTLLRQLDAVLRFKSKTEFAHFAKAIHIHKAYNQSSRTLENDIALIELQDPIDFGKEVACPICLKKLEPIAGDFCMTSGYGCMTPTKFNQPCANMRSRSLLRLRTSVAATSDCEKPFGKGSGDNKLCTISHPDEGVCFGDSGGPLICYDGETKMYYQTGVASHTIDSGAGEVCGRGAVMTVEYYTRVSKYHDWIKSIVKDIVIK